VSRGIYIPLPEPEREALISLADREWRQPREQAAKIVSDALRRAGALDTDHDQLTTGSPATVRPA